ncbi:hypothetical protein TraAM80_00052 [Trypanosoma rangeli]|uniref:AB hydrolase-1 domain-containing protein n=1 Tax=Trypanosoma rangeli TaxID=5698 RepID=A0A422P5E9_TRYRA|nr:uncharacterized protein TraAM80_00052 [Trypanosoma rangeli]RNF12894.1 hypothetical protein TraAM80_00052 [Trypanosoma rangeli]|eukprot:RNF12894.1 hypothetical protein TraAM80_00052 [Trypanosoma rangeli]
MNIRVSGNLQGPTVVFIAGWPDTSEVFRDNIMAGLASRYRLVGITLPGFDYQSPQLQKVKRCQEIEEVDGNVTKSSKMDFLCLPRMGYSFEELVDLFEIALFAAMEHHPFERPILVAHDWGYVIARELLLVRPYFFSRVVFLDGGGDLADPFPRKGSACDTGVVVGMWYQCWKVTLILIYQAFVILAFLILPTCVGKLVLRWLLQLMRRPQYEYTRHIPTRSHEADGNEELLMVPSCIHRNTTDYPRKSVRDLDIFNVLLHFNSGGGGPEQTHDVRSLAAAFNPSQFYYANGCSLYTQPPHPSARGIHYTCYRYRSANSHRSCGLPSRTRATSEISWNRLPLASTPSHDDEAVPALVDVDPSNGWIHLRYWMLWASRLLPNSQRFFIPISVPVLFLYGTEKTVMLHSQEWIEYIEEKGKHDGSQVVAVPGGHWFFAEKRNKRRVAERIGAFLDAD